MNILTDISMHEVNFFSYMNHNIRHLSEQVFPLFLLSEQVLPRNFCSFPKASANGMKTPTFLSMFIRHAVDLILEIMSKVRRREGKLMMGQDNSDFNRED